MRGGWIGTSGGTATEKKVHFMARKNYRSKGVTEKLDFKGKFASL